MNVNSTEALLGAAVSLVLLVLLFSWWVLYMSVRRGVLFQRDIARLEQERDQLAGRVLDLEALVPNDNNRRGRRRALAILERNRLRRRPAVMSDE